MYEEGHRETGLVIYRVNFAGATSVRSYHEALDTAQTLVVGVGLVDGRAQLTVRDQDIGIAPEDQERIFQQFERANSERAANSGLSLRGAA